MLKIKNTRILITGGAGFIGSHLAERLVKQGAVVTVADNLSRGKIQNISAVYKKIHFLKLDLRKEENCIKAVKNQDLVFNLAALNTGVDYDQGKTEQMFEENMLLQLLPIRAAGREQVKKFIQISSASIYSTDAMEKRIPTKETDDNDEPEVSKLGYALAKRMGEKLAKWYAKDTRMHTCSVRFINVYGTRDNADKLGHFIPTIIRKFIDSKQKVEIFGSGTQRRSFLHVEDAVDALLLIAQKGDNGSVYNVDPQDEHSVKEIVYEIRRLLSKQHINVVFNELLPEGSKRRMLDNTKIRTLGWVPQHTLLHSIQEIIDEVVGAQ